MKSKHVRAYLNGCFEQARPSLVGRLRTVARNFNAPLGNRGAATRKSLIFDARRRDGHDALRAHAHPRLSLRGRPSFTLTVYRLKQEKA